MKRLRWESPGEPKPLPRRPFRDTALVYAVIAALIVVVAVLTGGGLVRALVTAAVVFVAATLWSWRIWRNRLRAERQKNEERLR